MLLAGFLLQTVLLVVVLAILLRGRTARPEVSGAGMTELRDLVMRVDARSEGLDGHVRSAIDGLRREFSGEAQTGRDATSAAARELRAEVSGSVMGLGNNLSTALEGFRTENTVCAETLRSTVERNLDGIAHKISAAMGESVRNERESRETLHTRLRELSESNAAQQDKLRTAVEDRLQQINVANAEKLEQMRLTVDEKLHSTLHNRLTESFGQVTDQLNKVHTGLGEMTRLSEGVEGLSRIFTNVKSRGSFAEVQLGILLKQMLAPSQFVENEVMRLGSGERVEFAIRFPTNGGERLMPIDAKFPRESWERLEAAYASNSPEETERAGRAFENAIRDQAEKICEKYINSPRTTPYAVMFLPTEGLYAEVIRRHEFQSKIQSKCHVTIAGPTTLAAILTSFQMGFQMLALQEKGDEVWKILEATKTEFGKFGGLMDKFEGDFNRIQKTIGEVGVRTRAINRTLRDVSDPSDPVNLSLEIEDFARPSLSLAAVGEEE